ncbi:MAG: hypothetical protein AAFX93_19915 [Verrucomicrobiota bacterium]
MKPLSYGDLEPVISTGRSMYPLNDDGGWAVVTYWPWSLLKVGMVILFHHPEHGLICHQIVHINKGRGFFRRMFGLSGYPPKNWKVWTKGVNPMLKLDRWTVKKSDYIGLVVGSTPWAEEGAYFGGLYPYATAALRYNGREKSVDPEVNPFNARFFPKDLINQYNQ